MKMRTNELRLIETDEFPIEFLSQIAERESWRKEIHRPIYHIHKWWATRLGSVFRGILLGSTLPAGVDLRREFYRCHTLEEFRVFDPFMGSGTTIGEAHKLGMTALGRDINPVAVDAVRTAVGPLDRRRILDAFEELSDRVGGRIRGLYRSWDSRGVPCDVLYYFWVMQVACPGCSVCVDLFASHVIARNAYPRRRPEVQIRCPACGALFRGTSSNLSVTCPTCRHGFDAASGPARGAKCICPGCMESFTILDAVGHGRPAFRPYGKLILRSDGFKEYLAVSSQDLEAYFECSRLLRAEVDHDRIRLPELCLTSGHNTRQAMNYNFVSWTDFFNDRQLLALGWLHSAILELSDESTRSAFLTLFSGALEFNNLFASYKGEGTGAVRHMFSHHILKPERTPIEANVWGTHKSSGGFSNLLKSRLLRAIDYREAPTEVNGSHSPSLVCAEAFAGRVENQWPSAEETVKRGIYLSTGDSSQTRLADGVIDLVVTDPPFFDNVHYSELADFFHAWQQIGRSTKAAAPRSTRCPGEVQDSDPDKFASKLESVFKECNRVLREDGLLVFTYHHSRNEGWHAVAQAIRKAGFSVVNSHPIKAEMSVATPKSQAKEPIQLDIILVCRKDSASASVTQPSLLDALEAGHAKLVRLADAGLALSRNDRRIVLIGQLLTSAAGLSDVVRVTALAEQALDRLKPHSPTRSKGVFQPLLFA